MTDRFQAPFRFGADRELFGWLHSPSAQAETRELGIVLCNPIGDDSVRAHRTFRHLAERLAREGYAVLRFDFRGTGDSSGDEGDPGLVEGWLEDVNLAVQALLARTGCKRAGVIGLRLGATLAAAAASRGIGVSDVVLWNPYVSGKEFANDSIRQRKIQAMLDPAGFAMKTPQGTFDGDEALGFLIARETQAELAKVDLTKLEGRPAARVLLIEPRSTPAAEALLEKLRGSGATAELKAFDHKFLSMTPHLSTLPEHEIEEIIRWLGESRPQQVSAAGASREQSQAQGDSREEPVFYGADRFGILHRAAHAQDHPAIVVLNAGTVHRMGPHRMYVRMARRWAELGYNVLRIDISGIGDTPAEAGTTENVCYPPRHLSDVDAAIGFMRDRLSAKRFVLVGLCSGGDIAFQVASRDPRVEGVVIMNPRTFCVHDLATVESLEQTRQVQGSMNQKAKWIKLLKGQVNIAWHLRNFIPTASGILRRKFGHLFQTAKDPVPARLKQMTERGVNTLLLTSEHDPGAEYVDIHYPTEMRALDEVAGYKRIIFTGTDHTFTSLYAQKQVLETITEHLKRNHKAS